MGCHVALSYNSQMWRNAKRFRLVSGQDLGGGPGMETAGRFDSAVWLNQVIDHYIYSDATGATYRSTRIRRRLDLLRLNLRGFHANNDFLYFPMAVSGQ